LFYQFAIVFLIFLLRCNLIDGLSGHPWGKNSSSRPTAVG
jgi:hypothetical protein